MQGGRQDDHSSVVMRDGSIVLIGSWSGWNSGMHNEVWRFMPVGSSAKNPSHTYTKPGIYNVALQAYNSDGYTSTRKTGYITATSPLSTLTVTSPNGGETWQRGTAHTVAWSYTGSPGSMVKIVLLKAGVEVGTISANTSTGSGGSGSYLWNINPSGSTGNDYKVRISSISQPAISDPGNNTFTITPAATAQGYGKLAFVSYRDGNNEIYIMNANGTGQTRLTNIQSTDSEPAWSPDGSKIAFRSDRDGNGEIYVMNADGSGQTRLTNNLKEDRGPAWSPDGSKIAFVSFRNASVGIYVMNADGTGQTPLTQYEDGEPAWSPDGSKIAFVSYAGLGGHIYVMNADGTGKTRLTTNSEREEFPSWSPDGSKIAFEYYFSPTNHEIYIINADGTGQIRFTNNSAIDSAPTWSPDGTRVAFSSMRDGNDEIYVINADGNGLTRLTNNGEGDGDPRLAVPV